MRNEDVPAFPLVQRQTRSEIRVLAIPGSLRAASLNALVAQSLQALAPERAVVDVYQGCGRLPLYNEDFDTSEPPEAVADLRRRVIEADALFWAMPEFNHTIPSVVKNVIEWISHPLSTAALVGKVSAIAVATRGRGGYRGMADLARILRDLGGHVVAAPEVCIHVAHTAISEGVDGGIHFADPTTEQLLRLLLKSLCRAVDNDAGAHSGAPWRLIFQQDGAVEAIVKEPVFAILS